ncbi:hypothetical protein jhhlp_002422 [Lomentospora prolificans]|uniref:Uncharacterized protein n=1 Tax=Lomentospora prolificans TaxID=41688 RepID=A0A2N3NDW2_9PEZI|nr:hypothetical protein jhhlp_002422 [Lomentospora prolificans]
MDLDSTLIRAEQLFRRFKRLVETIDKTHSLPLPRPQPQNHRTSSSVSSTTSEQIPTPASSIGPSSPRRDTGKGPELTPPTERVITPELRKLLSRKIELVPKKKGVPK